MAAAPEPPEPPEPEAPPSDLEVDLEVNNTGVKLRFRCTTGVVVILGVAGVTIGAIFGRERIKPIVESLCNSVFGICKVTEGSLVIEVECFTVTHVKGLLDMYLCGELKRKFLEELRKIGGTVEDLKIEFDIKDTLMLNEERRLRIVKQEQTDETEKVDKETKNISNEQFLETLENIKKFEGVQEDIIRRLEITHIGFADYGSGFRRRDRGFGDDDSGFDSRDGSSNDYGSGFERRDGGSSDYGSGFERSDTGYDKYCGRYVDFNSDLRDKYGRTFLHYAAQYGISKLKYIGYTSCRSVVDVQDYDGRTALHLACLSGNRRSNEEVVKFLVRNVAGINAEDSEGRTPLHYAAMHNEDLVTLLISRKANIFAIDYYSKTPLDYAFERGYSRTIKVLLDNFASRPEVDDKSSIMKNMNVTDKAGRNILHHAANIANETAIVKLVDSGINVNVVDNNQMSALDHALACKNVKNAVVLFSIIMLEKKSPDNLALTFLENLEMRDRTGRKLLHYSVINSKQNVLDLLLERNVRLNDVDSSGMSALHFAAERGNVVAFEKLVRKGANIDGKNGNKCTVLHLAASNGDERLVDLLIKKNLNVNEIDSKGRSALHYSIERGKVVTSMKLLEAGASVNGKNDEGQTVLHLAVQRYDEKLIDELIKKNADVNEIDNKGRSAIHYSIERGNVVASMKLLEAGASVNGKNDEGQTVLHLAVQRYDEKLIDELIKKNADVNEIDNKGRSALHYSIGRGNVVTSMKLLEAGASVNGKNDKGETVLHLAVQSNNQKMIDELINKNADVNEIDNKGRSALHYSIERGNKLAAMKLVEAGASVKDLLKDEDGRTLLHKAARESQLQVLDCLVKCNVSLNDVDNQGETALHHGVKSGTIHVVRTLLEAGAKVNVKSEEYKLTPLHYALLRRDDRIIKLLLQYEANPNDEDYAGKTAITLARELNYSPHMIEKLEVFHFLPVEQNEQDGNDFL